MNSRVNDIGVKKLREHSGNVSGTFFRPKKEHYLFVIKTFLAYLKLTL